MAAVPVAFCAANPPACAAAGKLLLDGAIALGAILIGAAAGVLLSEAIEDAAQDHAEEEAGMTATDCPEGGERPPRDKCNKAIKLLMQYERLMKKFGKKLPEKRLKQLDELRDSGRITSKDLPGTIQKEFPPEFAGKTLDQIKKECGG